jgi:hypothetical protein
MTTQPYQRPHQRAHLPFHFRESRLQPHASPRHRMPYNPQFNISAINQSINDSIDVRRLIPRLILAPINLYWDKIGADRHPFKGFDIHLVRKITILSFASNSFTSFKIQSTSVKLLLGQLHIEMRVPNVSPYEFASSSCTECFALFLQPHRLKQAKTHNYLSKFEFSHHPPLSDHTTSSPHRFLEAYFCHGKTHAQRQRTWNRGR